jgi:FkbM family methyltransferase
MNRSNFKQYIRTNTAFEEIFAGEYDLDLKQPPATVLDIGANEGAFTAWALERWPDCRIFAYEPIPLNAAMFKENHGGNARVKLFECAVLAGDHDKAPMHLGKNNSGECSIHDIGEQIIGSFIEVKCADASLIGTAEFVKIDTEGCELEIIEKLDLSDTKALVCEFHRRQDVAKIVAILEERGFKAEFWTARTPDRGILKFARQGALNAAKSVPVIPEPTFDNLNSNIPDEMQFHGKTRDGKTMTLEARHLRYPFYVPELAGIKLFLGIPIYSQATTAFMRSLLELQAQKPLPMEVHFGQGDGVARTRNRLTATFLKSDCTDLLLADCDLIFSADHIVKMAAARQKVIGGFYPKKQEGAVEWVVNYLPGIQTTRPDGLHPLKYVGSGFIMVAREVFEKMIEAYPEIRFREDYADREIAYDFWSMGNYRDAEGEAVICALKLLRYFSSKPAEIIEANASLITDLKKIAAHLPEMDEGRYLSEDWYFCQRWLDLGGEIFGHARVMLRHCGSVVFPLKSQIPEIMKPRMTAGNCDAALPAKTTAPGLSTPAHRQTTPSPTPQIP